MTKTQNTLLAAAIAGVLCATSSTAALAAGGWGGETVAGNGKLTTQARTPGHFTGVAMDMAGNVEVRMGGTEGVTIETDENLLPLIETVVEKGVLHIRPVKHRMSLRAKTVHVVVAAKDIDTLSLGGSGSMVADALHAPQLELSLGGSGTIDVKGVDTKELSLALGGSGKVQVEGGKAASMGITIGGSGDVDAGKVQAGKVEVTVGGSGHSTVWARDSLAVTIAGSGDVHYYGDPKVSKTVLGSGNAIRLGATPR
jgi:hypothetical protein